MRLSSSRALIPALAIGILSSCQTSAPAPDSLPEVIRGMALPVRLLPDSTWIPMDDFSPDTLPDSTVWIPAWGNGSKVIMTENNGHIGVWIKGQPEQGFGALAISSQGETAHVPVFASHSEQIEFVLTPDEQGHQDVKIMGAFNGWSRVSTPLSLGDDGLWRVTLTLPEGQHPYQLIVDGV